MATPTFGHLNSPRGAVQSQNWVWDAGLLDWVPAQQALLEGAEVTVAGPLAVTGPLTNIELRAADVKVTLDGEVVPVSGTIAVSNAFALEATQLLQATAAKQDVLLAELQLKADLTETQPVSAALLPLPTGASTGVKQDTLLAELQLKADLTETQPVSLATVPSHAVTNTGTFAVQAAAQPGIDVGDVTVNNASGAAAVNIQDGGNSITVDGTVIADTELPAAVALADGASATPTTPTVGAIPLLMNATTEDRQRSVSIILDTPGTGIAAAGLMAVVDGSAPIATTTDGNFGPLRMTPNRSLHTAIWDGDSGENGASVKGPSTGASFFVDSALVITQRSSEVFNVSGTFGTNNSSLSATLTLPLQASIFVFAGGSGGLQITGNWSGTIVFQASLNTTDYTPLPILPISDGTTTTGALIPGRIQILNPAVISTRSNGIWVFGLSGLGRIKAQTAADFSGSASITWYTNPGSQVVRVLTLPEMNAQNSANDPLDLYDMRPKTKSIRVTREGNLSTEDTALQYQLAALLAEVKELKFIVSLSSGISI